ncbi:MAG: hypothetical protein UV96_C0018G0015 [Parcubacteria group bacterium GW2011_GWF2_43_38]|nr:MAG: hypothetical protein UV96_C0018G0015 [Parcubacteria group bacterium GW2011_GWF2_43_38]
MAAKISEQLTEFIARARTQGKPDNEIRSLLITSGWDERFSKWSSNTSRGFNATAAAGT